MSTPAPSSRARSLFGKAASTRVRAELAQAGWAIAQIALVALIAAGVIFAWIQMLDPLPTGLPLMLAIGVPIAAAMIAIVLIGRRLSGDNTFRAALERARLLLVQSMHHVAARGDGGVLVGRIDLHDAGISSRSSFSRAATFDATAAALLSALAFLAERIIAFTAHFSSSLRVSATA